MNKQGNESPALRETHSACVLLVGDRAYKWKKPIAFEFLDFRTRDQRLRACEREAELNRRLAPDVYLGVATLDTDDEVSREPVLVMRRLPDDRKLARLVDARADVGACLHKIAREVARLHADTRTPDATGPASRDAVRDNWSDNLDDLRAHGEGIVHADEVEEAGALALEYLDGRDDLFSARRHLACDGHGDLLADDIFCLDDGPRIIDCLDFADRYRLGDPLLDAAFLVMDLERHGRPDLGTAFLDAYLEFTGDVAPESLAHHFVAYRAHVRAKVGCLRAAQGDPSAVDEARSAHDVVLDRLRRGRVTLTVVGGLPGTGKSTIAEGVAEAHGWTLLSSDDVRKDLAGVARSSQLGPQHYTVEARTAVYEELLRRVDRLLGMGEHVVVDASWHEPAWRDAARTVAYRRRAAWVPLRADTPVTVAADRLRRRAREGASASDASPEVLDQLAARASPWPDARTVDGTGAPEGCVQRALTAVDELRGRPPRRDDA